MGLPWIDLAEPISIENAVPVLNDAAYTQLVAEIHGLSKKLLPHLCDGIGFHVYPALYRICQKQMGWAIDDHPLANIVSASFNELEQKSLQCLVIDDVSALALKL